MVKKEEDSRAWRLTWFEGGSALCLLPKEAGIACARCHYSRDTTLNQTDVIPAINVERGRWQEANRDISGALGRKPPGAKRE